MSLEEARTLKDACQGAGLADAFEAFALAAIKFREAQIDLEQKKRDYEEQARALTQMARVAGINVPSVAASDVANLYA